MPVLPLVGSMMTVSFLILPSRSPASIIDTPMRSLTDQRGLKLSGLATTVPFALPVTRRQRARPRRLGVDLDAAVHEVDDPVDRDAGPGVDAGLVAPVAQERGLGDFDDQPDVGGRRVPVEVGAGVTSCHGEIRFGLAVG